MTINRFVLKGDLNGKIVVVRFFFFVGYTYLSARNLEIVCSIFVWLLEPLHKNCTKYARVRNLIDRAAALKRKSYKGISSSVRGG